MKRSILYSLFFSTLLIVLWGCQEEIVENDKDQSVVEGDGIIINKKQKIVNLSTADISELISNDTVIYQDKKWPKYKGTIQGSEEEMAKIEPGVIINIPSGGKGGKLIFVYDVEARVKKATDSKGLVAVIIEGIQASLDMYFNYENATLEFSTPGNRSKSNLDIPNKLNSSSYLPLNNDEELSFDYDLNGVSFSSSPTELCKLEFNTTLWKSGSSYIKTNGSFIVHPAIDFFLRYEPVESKAKWKDWLESIFVPDAVLILYKDKNYYLGNLKTLQSNVYIDIDKEIEFHIHLEKAIDREPYTIPIGALTIPTVPVSGQMELAFEIDFDALGELDLDIYKNEEKDIAVGIDLDRDLPEPTWHYEFDQRSESGFNLKAKVELTAGIYLVLETEVYVLGVIGPELTASAFLEANASVNASASSNDQMSFDWELTAEAGIKGEAALNLSGFHIDKATVQVWNMIEKEYRKTIYHAPDYLNIIGGNYQTGQFGELLPNPITIGAYDSRDKLIKYLPVPLYFETNNGSIDPSGMVLTSEGKASTNWTLGNNEEEQVLNVYFKKDYSRQGEIKVNATADYGFKTIKIGNQTWMAENLKTDVGEGCWAYNNNENNVASYGRLYTWEAAKRACPDGWHIPSDADWEKLAQYISNDNGGYNKQEGHWFYVGNHLKSKTGWANGGNGTDDYNFSALPGGLRDLDGIFDLISEHGIWWSSTSENSTQARVRLIANTSSSFLRLNYPKEAAFSVRCIKD